MSDNSARVQAQKFGRFLSAMVMPNIGAFIAWGLITALFIPTGWLPNENLSKLVGPMITYLLPLLIGYTGGTIIGGKRGGVVGAITTMGVIVGADIPMFLGAMIAGPLGGAVIKGFDKLIDGKVKLGFEMLINNFSAGILGAILALISYKAIGPAVEIVTKFLMVIVNKLVDMHLLPLVSIVVEPAKIFFLNNAVNHGIFTPLGTEQVTQMGKSIFFMIEANPGPGLGILLAYTLFGKGNAKQSAPGAIIIHFFGGIHEIYFPYVLMNPALFLAVIAGGMTGVATNMLLNTGLVSPASPGSILAIAAVTAKGSFLGIMLSVLLATVVSFLVASIFVKRAAGNSDDDDFEAAASKMSDLKGGKKELIEEINSGNIKKIIVACDAGMGSSAMGASLLKKRLEKAGLNIIVENKAINEIPKDADMVITHKDLTARAKSVAPEKIHLSLTNFVDGDFYDEVVNNLKKVAGSSESNIKKSEIPHTDEHKTEEILKESNIKLGLASVSKEEAIKSAGELLKNAGYVEEEYIQGMLDREKLVSTYLDYGIAIPHGEAEVKEKVKKTGIVVLQYPQGIDYGDGNIVNLVIGIAGKGNEHIDIIAKLAGILDDEDEAKKLVSATDSSISIIV